MKGRAALGVLHHTRNPCERGIWYEIITSTRTALAAKSVQGRPRHRAEGLKITLWALQTKVHCFPALWCQDHKVSTVTEVQKQTLSFGEKVNLLLIFSYPFPISLMVPALGHTGNEKVAGVFVHFYLNFILYWKMALLNQSIISGRNLTPRDPRRNRNLLESAISREEIENAVSHLPSGKALTPDGFNSVLQVLRRTSVSLNGSAVSPLSELQ